MHFHFSVRLRVLIADLIQAIFLQAGSGLANKTFTVFEKKMGESPVTRRSLLVRLKDSRDNEAWSDFIELYAPLVHAYCMKRGMQDADAADAAQEVLSSVSRAIPGFDYDPAKGTFRGWLFQITRNQMAKNFQRQVKVPKATGDTAFHQALEQEADLTDEEEVWEREYQQQLFRWAAQKIEPEFKQTTWKAFWMVSVESVPAGRVASELGISVGAVYIAKSRVTSRLRSIIESVDPHH
ncbi:MAG: sigma-70 family RNA polymerase sigma factor [Planctomycetota bacterium]